MALEEVYTLVGLHLGDECNRDRFWYKHVIFSLRYIFGEVVSDGSIFHCGKSIVPLRVKILKHKTGYLIFGMTAPKAVLACSETCKGVKWVQSKWKLVRNHPPCILFQFFPLKPPPVYNSEVIVVFSFWVLLELHFPFPTTGFLSEIYHHPILEGMVIRYMLLSTH